VYLNNTTTTLACSRGSNAAIDSSVHFIEYVQASGNAVNVGDVEGHAFNTTASATCLAAPSASNTRSVKKAWWRNKDATLSCDVEVVLNSNSVLSSLHKATLTPGDTLEYIENVGFFVITNTSSSVIDANANTADVSANAADTYLTGSALNVSNLIQAGSVIRWRLSATKTAAGANVPTFNIRFGTNGNTSDAARCIHTMNTQTAAADTAWVDLEAIVRAVGASGQLQSALQMTHKLATTGFASVSTPQIVQNNSATFDTTPSGSIIGLSVNANVNGNWTFQTISVTADNLIKQR
jgi:hypothetical protein